MTIRSHAGGVSTLLVTVWSAEKRGQERMALPSLVTAQHEGSWPSHDKKIRKIKDHGGMAGNANSFVCKRPPERDLPWG